MNRRRRDPFLALFASFAVCTGLCGCITPPVVAEAHVDGWTLGESTYPRDGTVVEVRGAGEDAPVLRGLFVPSDRGAPIVVHFAESGGSITSSLHRRDQYAALSELGFASLAIDYRGVGLSDGKRSPQRLDEDALAIWEHALQLVDGDASRLVIRGTSLGTVAASSLLARGVTPGAVIAFAPVRPETVARRYGYAVFWDPLVWLVAPLLARFSEGDPLEWLTRPGVPRLVVASPRDELLGERDFGRLSEGVEASGGTCHVPKSLSIIVFNNDPVMEALGNHIALTRPSFDVGDVESAFLRGAFPGVPDVDQRLDRLQRIGPESAVENVWSSRDALARLKGLLGQYRRPPAALALAAALLLESEELDFFGTWFRERLEYDYRESTATMDSAEITELLDLDDAAGRLSIELIAAARAVLGRDMKKEQRPRWSRERVHALASACLGITVPGQVFEEGGTQLAEGEDWRFGVASDGLLPYAIANESMETSGSLYVGMLLEAFSKDAVGRTREDAERRFRLCVNKAAGLLERAGAPQQAVTSNDVKR